MDELIIVFMSMKQNGNNVRKGYYVDTTGKNTSRIAEYIKHQLEEDKLGDQLSFVETKK